MDQPFALRDDSPIDLGHGSRASMRHDQVTAQTVDIGIRLQEVIGTRDAASFLKNNVIAIEVALRVLLRPGMRRQN